MNFEAISHMTKSSEPKRQEKSQETLRETLEEKLKSLKPALQEGIKEYQEALKDDTFEDKEGEPDGAGEARKESMQKKLTLLFDRAEKMKTKLDSKEPLPDSTPEISVIYTGRDGKAEQITLDLEAKLQDFISFYQKTGLDLPSDFEDTARDIWQKNQAEIEQAMRENGFDDMLIIPATPDLKELSEKMKMENGYYFYQVKDDFSDVKSQNADKPRIILFHHCDSLPEIREKTGLDIHLNITGADAEKLYQANPENYLGTLEDAIILERKYLEDTLQASGGQAGKHLSDYTSKSAHWLPGSKAGARLVYSCWRPDDRGLLVLALGGALRGGLLGARPSRCFF